MADRTKSAMGGASKPKSKAKKKSSKKTKAKRIREMRIRRMSGDDNQQFSITHDQHPGSDGTTPPPEEHGAADEQGLMDHLAQHAPNIGPAEPEPAPQQQMV